MCSGRPQADTGLNSNSTLPYAWMLCGVIAFSVMAALTHMLGGLFEWNLVATARTGLALTISAALTYWAGAKFVFWGPRALWIRSIAGSVSLLCTFYALPRLPISDVLTLTNMFPIWVALLSWPLVGETPSLSAWLAIALGMVGVVLVAQPHLVHDEKLPAAMAVVASLSTAVSMLGLHRLQQSDRGPFFVRVTAGVPGVARGHSAKGVVDVAIRRAVDFDAAGGRRDGHDRPDFLDEGFCGRVAGQGVGCGVVASGLCDDIRRRGRGSHLWRRGAYRHRAGAGADGLVDRQRGTIREQRSLKSAARVIG